MKTQPTTEQPALAAPLSSGADLIAAERRRQIEQEGWTAEHDDGHVDFEMAGAASSYAQHVQGKAWLYTKENPSDYQEVEEILIPDEWPIDWDLKWFKPTSPLRDLVKAGALIAAEIDRLQRLSKQGS